MRRDFRPAFHPQSPVQPYRSRARYVLPVAAAVALLLWFANEWWTTRTAERAADFATTSGHSRNPAVHETTGARGASGDVRGVFSTDDYPAEAIAKDEQGTVQARLDIGTSGQVTRCTIIRSSGHEVLDRTTCNILRRRAHFKAAHDANGNAISDSYVTPPITWVLPT